MTRLALKSLAMTMLLALILCGAYPLAVTVVSQLAFSHKANGGIVRDEKGAARGAGNIGQLFTKPWYFHGRPSAAGSGYDAAASSGSNLGPTNQKLFTAVKSNVDAVLKENPTARPGQVPVDLVTASASGLDPHVSPEAALLQADRVAKARGIAPAQIRSIVEGHIEGPQLGFLGEPVVNVLFLNMDLDRKYSHTR